MTPICVVAIFLSVFLSFVLSGCDEQDTHHQCSLRSNEGLPSVLGAAGTRPKRYLIAQVLSDENKEPHKTRGGLSFLTGGPLWVLILGADSPNTVKHGLNVIIL